MIPIVTAYNKKFLKNISSHLWRHQNKTHSCTPNSYEILNLVKLEQTDCYQWCYFNVLITHYELGQSRCDTVFNGCNTA